MAIPPPPGPTPPPHGPFPPPHGPFPPPHGPFSPPPGPVSPPPGPAGPTVPQGPPLPGPPAPSGYYPQQAYYAPGWTTPTTAAPRRGHVWLWFGLIVGAVVLLVVAGAVVGITNWAQTRPLGDISHPTSATARQVDTGHCITGLPADGQVGSVRLVPCDQAHEAEVVGVMTLTDESWPGQESVDDEVGAWCEMDTAQREAGFRAVVWTPSQRSWGQGDHRGVCIAWHDAGSVTGSFRTGDVAAG